MKFFKTKMHVEEFANGLINNKIGSFDFIYYKKKIKNNDQSIKSFL